MENGRIKNAIVKRQRSRRVRKRLRGDCDKPRLCVVKTNAHIQVQLIDDDAGVTLGAISTFSKEFRNTPYCKRNKESARQIGLRIAQIASEKNIKRVVFDRGSSKYHGVVAAVAESARENGLSF